MKMKSCRWLSFSKMQFYGYPLFKWDLVGCCGLNIKKKEKKAFPILLKGALQEK